MEGSRTIDCLCRCLVGTAGTAQSVFETLGSYERDGLDMRCSGGNVAWYIERRLLSPSGNLELAMQNMREPLPRAAAIDLSASTYVIALSVLHTTDSRYLSHRLATLVISVHSSRRFLTIPTVDP